MMLTYNVHRLELQKFFNFCAANLPVKRDIGPRDEITLFLILDMRVRNKKSGISSLYLA